MKEFKKFTLRTFTNRGYNLTPIELREYIPFEVKRVYYFYGLPDKHNTGEHSHIVEEEIFVQARGTSVAVIDRGQGKEDIALAENEAIYCPNFVWHGFKRPSPDCLILALSSTNYSPDRSDYIEDYAQFLRTRESKK